jgi:hypothetical protein
LDIIDFEADKTALFVILRCISRFVLIRNPGPDDYLIVGAMVRFGPNNPPLAGSF